LAKTTAIARPQRDDAGNWGTEAVVALWAWLVMAGVFLALAAHAASGHVARTDLRLLNAAQRLPDAIAPWVDLQTRLGNPILLAACTAALAVILFTKGWWIEALVVLSSFSVFAFVVLVKHVIAEAPPYLATHAEYEGLLESNYSFPSGHVLGVSVFCGLVFLFADRLTQNGGAAFILRLVMLASIASVGPGRVWLGVHYPSDVVAAYLLAALFLLPVHFCFSAWRRTMRRRY
jgi:membrane-associated phospholipid phosphatase